MNTLTNIYIYFIDIHNISMFTDTTTTAIVIITVLLMNEVPSCRHSVKWAQTVSIHSVWGESCSWDISFVRTKITLKCRPLRVASIALPTDPGQAGTSDQGHAGQVKVSRQVTARSMIYEETSFPLVKQPLDPHPDFLCPSLCHALPLCVCGCVGV